MNVLIRWNRKAIEQFEEAIAYIEEDSPANAEKFKIDIIFKIDGLAIQPEKYSPDKYKLNNDGSFRAFEIYSYRIGYRYKNGKVPIIRLRHTKMNPVNY